MATRSNANATANTNPAVSNDDYIDDTMGELSTPAALKDDIDDIPDGLDDEGAVPRSVPQTNAPSTASGMGLDKLGSLGFDEERDESVRKALNPPRGDWMKSERWKKTEIVYSGDCMPGDVNSDGRTVVMFSGELDARIVGDTEYDHVKCVIKWSPDVRYKPEQPNVPDLASKIFNRSKDLYTEIHNARPQNLQQLMDMLTEDKYIVNVFNTDSGMMAGDVKDPRKVAQRRRA